MEGGLLRDETSSLKQSSVRCGDTDSFTSHGHCSQGCPQPSHSQLVLCLPVRGPAAQLPSLSPPPSMPKCYHQCCAGAGLCVPHCVVLEKSDWIPSHNEGFWLWGCFQLSAEGLIYFFLMIRWPVANTAVSPMLPCSLVFTYKLLIHSSSTPWQRWIHSGCLLTKSRSTNLPCWPTFPKKKKKAYSCPWQHSSNASYPTMTL